MTTATFVIVGAGQAGGWAAKTLRDQGFSGRIVLYGSEAHPPYERPPLSKGVIAGSTPLSETMLFTPAQLQADGIEFFPRRTVRGLKPEDRLIILDDGEAVSYDRALLCTGGRPLVPAFHGADSRDVFFLRTFDDAERLKDRLSRPRQKVVVIGAGWIGLEVAATARSLGNDVRIFEAANRVCARSVIPEVSPILAALHETQGVDIQVSSKVSSIEPLFSGGSTVRLSNGQEHYADVVVLGTGLVSNDGLAREAGLACDGGILVDTRCRTSDEHIFAAGDVTVIEYGHLGIRSRLESWQNAQDQGVAAARAMLDQEVSYQPVPLVWSEQYDAMIQLAGHAQLATHGVVRPLGDKSGLLAFGLDASGQVKMAVGINAGREYRVARRFVEGSISVDPHRLADPATLLSSLLAR